MLSVLNLMILRLDVDSVEDFADFGSAGANPVDHSMDFGGEGNFASPVRWIGPSVSDTLTCVMDAPECQAAPLW